jgi:hypothetical protein
MPIAHPRAMRPMRLGLVPRFVVPATRKAAQGGLEPPPQDKEAEEGNRCLLVASEYIHIVPSAPATTDEMIRDGHDMQVSRRH